MRRGTACRQVKHGCASHSIDSPQAMARGLYWKKRCTVLFSWNMPCGSAARQGGGAHTAMLATGRKQLMLSAALRNCGTGLPRTIHPAVGHRDVVGWPQGLPHILSEVVAASACECRQLGVRAGNCSDNIKQHIVRAWQPARACIASPAQSAHAHLAPSGHLAAWGWQLRAAGPLQGATPQQCTIAPLRFTWTHRAEDINLN